MLKFEIIKITIVLITWNFSQIKNFFCNICSIARPGMNILFIKSWQRIIPPMIMSKDTLIRPFNGISIKLTHRLIIFNITLIHFY